MKVKERQRCKERPCPLCGGDSSDDFYPFCSDRCRLIDLGKWLDETYKISTDEKAGESEKEEGQ